MAAAAELGGNEVNAHGGVFCAEAGAERVGALLDERADFDAFDAAGVVNEALGVLGSGAGFFKDAGGEQADAGASAAFEGERGEERLEELEAVPAFALVDFVAGLGGVGAAGDKLGGELEGERGRAVETELPGVGVDARVEGPGGDGVDGEREVEEEAGEHFADGGGGWLDDVDCGVGGAGEVVVDATGGAGEAEPGPGAAAVVAGAVSKDGGGIFDFGCLVFDWRLLFRCVFGEGALG